jgi:hypothetical protein
MDFTHSQIMPKPLKFKFSIPFTTLFYQTFHSSNKLFSSNEGVSKGPKHPIIYRIKNLKSYTSHGSPCNSTCTLICNMIFLMNHHYWVMHINLCKKINLWVTILESCPLNFSQNILRNQYPWVMHINVYNFFLNEWFCLKIMHINWNHD